MEEELVTFETAKLAKEKGFNIHNSSYFFNKQGEEIINYYYENRNKNSLLICRPTQSLLQKWLREKHNIHTEIKIEDYVSSPKFYWVMFGPIGTHIRCVMNSGDKGKTEYYSSYEKALENALEEGLKLN